MSPKQTSEMKKASEARCWETVTFSASNLVLSLQNVRLIGATSSLVSFHKESITECLSFCL